MNKIVNFGIQKISNILTTSLYVHSGIDFTVPTQIYMTVNRACNSKCKMCTNWRVNPKKNELSAKFWINALNQLKSINPNIKVSFTGGECLLKKDFLEIVNFCNNKNILWGITTNGILLNSKYAVKLLSYNPFNINISIDSLNNKTYTEIRGVACLNTVKSNLSFIIKYSQQSNIKPNITIKTMICNKNINELPSLAKYAMKQKVTGITFQPIFKTTKESKIMFNINIEKLKEIIDELIIMKKKGYNILNSEKNMKGWVNYFKGEMKTIKNFKCKVPLTSLYISPTGDISFCDWSKDKIGNITDSQLDIKKLLNFKKTKLIKKSLVYCKTPCSYCIQRTFRDYLTLFFNYIK